jgi:hypothetical protein
VAQTVWKHFCGISTFEMSVFFWEHSFLTFGWFILIDRNENFVAMRAGRPDEFVKKNAQNVCSPTHYYILNVFFKNSQNDLKRPGWPVCEKMPTMYVAQPITYYLMYF